MSRVVINYDVIENLYRDHELTSKTRKWLDTVFHKWMINEYPNVKEVNPASFRLTIKQQKWLSAGATLVEINVDAEFSEKLWHMIDFIQSDQTQYPRQFALRSLQGISAPHMFKRVEWWSNWMERQARKIQKTDIIPDGPGDVITVREWEHYELVRLNSSEAYKREGKLMGHCIGTDSYIRDFKEGAITAYSIRTKDTIPHVTFHIDHRYKDQINQIQGFKDHAPAARYIPFIRESLEFLGATNITDGALRKIGYLLHDGKLYDKRLHRAAESGDVEMVRFLVDNGYSAILNVSDPEKGLLPLGLSIGTPAMHVLIDCNARLTDERNVAYVKDKLLVKLVSLMTHDENSYIRLTNVFPMVNTIVSEEGMKGAIESDDPAAIGAIIKKHGLNGSEIVKYIEQATWKNSINAIQYFDDLGWLDDLDLGDSNNIVESISSGYRDVNHGVIFILLPKLHPDADLSPLMLKASSDLDIDLVERLHHNYNIPLSWEYKEETHRNTNVRWIAQRVQVRRINSMFMTVSTTRNDGDQQGKIDIMNRLYAMSQDLLNDQPVTVLDVAQKAELVEWLINKDAKFSRTSIFDRLVKDTDYTWAKLLITRLIEKHSTKLKRMKWDEWCLLDLVKKIVEADDERFVSYLCKKGVFRTMGTKTWASVMYTLERGNAKSYRIMRKILIASGRGVDVKTRYGMTFLMHAVRLDYKNISDMKSHLHFIKYLLDLGANPNSISYAKRDGRCDPATSVMHEAIKSGCWQVVELLVKRGGNVNLKNNAGVPAFFRLPGFLKSMKTPKAEDLDAVISAYKKMAKTLRKLGMDNTLTDPRGRTAWGGWIPKKGWKREVYDIMMS